MPNPQLTRDGLPVDRNSHWERVSPSPVERHPKTKAAEVIADHFRRDIAGGALQVGDVLPPEGELVEHFDVSRPTLRSAFRILESEGLLEIGRGPRGGPRVRHPDVEATARAMSILLHLRGTRVGEFFAAQAAVEVAAIELLAEAPPAQALDAIERALQEEQYALDDPASFGGKASLFYQALTDNCGNEILAVFGAVLQRLLLDVLSALPPKMNTASAETRRVTLDAHRRLYQFILKGQSAAAVRHWSKHFEWLRTLYPGLSDRAFSHLDRETIRRG